MWFSEMTGTLIGAIGGTTIGLFGALFGVLASRWAPRGLKQRIILGANVVGIILGVLFLAAGLIALLNNQVYHVWYPLMLLGGISTAVMTPIFFRVRQVYARAELRKMQIEDA